jgi:hypothetical protein
MGFKWLSNDVAHAFVLGQTQWSNPCDANNTHTHIYTHTLIGNIKAIVEQQIFHLAAVVTHEKKNSLPDFEKLSNY